MDDPILYGGTLLALLLIPVISYWLSTFKRKWIYLPPLVGLAISFPMFLFVVINPTLPISKVLFYISITLWTGSFFGLFVSFMMARSQKKK